MNTANRKVCSLIILIRTLSILFPVVIYFYFFIDYLSDPKMTVGNVIVTSLIMGGIGHLVLWLLVLLPCKLVIYRLCLMMMNHDMESLEFQAIEMCKVNKPFPALVAVSYKQRALYIQGKFNSYRRTIVEGGDIVDVDIDSKFKGGKEWAEHRGYLSSGGGAGKSRSYSISKWQKYLIIYYNLNEEITV